MASNKFDEKYDIRLARYDEIDEIMKFIDIHWRKGHIMASNRNFFEYEFVHDNIVQFVIAKDKTDGKIHGLHGYLLASQNRSDKFDTWGSIWKVVPGSMGLLGWEIVKRLQAITGTRAFLSIGGNPETTVPMLKKFQRFEDVGKMQHFYCLSPKKNYRIAKIDHYESFDPPAANEIEIKCFNDFNQLQHNFDFSLIGDSFPYKDAWYIKRRYFTYPIFSYQVYGLFDAKSEKAQALIVCREQEYDGAKALRIVDYIGKDYLFGNLGEFFRQNLLEYEYIDLYCYGFNNQFILQSGMTELKEEDTNIGPNYFAPYVAKNIDIWIGSPKKGAVFFKADGDQDRPNKG